MFLDEKEKELLEKLEKIKGNKKLLDRLIKLEDYAIDVKVQRFNKMYNYAYEQLLSKLEKGYLDDNYEYYTWEEVIKLLSPDIWDLWNSIDEV